MSSTRVSTQRTQLKSSQLIEVLLGRVDTGIVGLDGYAVQPYLYCTKSGTLVLDYKVDLAWNNANPTWWELNYGEHPDLAFTQIKRYEVEKGSTIPEDERQETQNIQINPLRPFTGDTVDLFARVHNYSVME